MGTEQFDAILSRLPVEMTATRQIIGNLALVNTTDGEVTVLDVVNGIAGAVAEIEHRLLAVEDALKDR